MWNWWSCHLRATGSGQELPEMPLGVVGQAWFGIALTGAPGYLSERSILIPWGTTYGQG